MPTDLLSLALAAAMPLAAFAFYAGVRSLRDRRARRPSRARRDGRASSAPTPREMVRPAAQPIDRTRQIHPPPTARSVDPLPAEGLPAARSAAAFEPDSRMLARVHVTRPEPARPQPGRMLVKLAVSRPTETSSRNGHAATIPSPASAPPLPVIPDGRPTGAVEPPARPMPSARHEPGPIRGQRPSFVSIEDESATVRTDAGAIVGSPGGLPSSTGGVVERSPRPRRPGLLARTLKPIGSALGRHDSKRDATIPAWPEPDRLDDPFSPLVNPADGSGPCPFCANSRERGAWFCRRCRQPLDSRATAATSALNLPPSSLADPVASTPLVTPPLATPPLATPPSFPRPSAVPAQPDAGPLIARLPVVRPTQYVPATRPGSWADPERTSTGLPAPADSPPIMGSQPLRRRLPRPPVRRSSVPRPSSPGRGTRGPARRPRTRRSLPWGPAVRRTALRRIGPRNPAGRGRARRSPACGWTRRST